MSNGTARLTDAVQRLNKVIEAEADELEKRYEVLGARVKDGAHKLKTKATADEAAILAFENMVNQLTNSGGLTDEQIAAENAAEGVAAGGRDDAASPTS